MKHTPTLADQFEPLTQAALALGRESISLKVLRWLREHCADIPADARDELLTILGVEK